jgi:hypothetical protein
MTGRKHGLPSKATFNHNLSDASALAFMRG